MDEKIYYTYPAGNIEMKILIKYMLREYWKILTLIVIFMFIYTYCQIEIISDLPILMLVIKEYTIELQSLLEMRLLTIFHIFQ